MESRDSAHLDGMSSSELLDMYMEQGFSISEAAGRAGIARSWAYKLLAKKRRAEARPYITENRDATDPGAGLSDEEIEHGPPPRAREDLCRQARRAQGDFGYFCRRYFGRIDTPWRSIAAARTLELLDSGDKEYLVTNAPPGVGKSVLFTHDIPAWLIIKDRSVRILIGSRTQNQAEKLVGRLGRALKSRYLLMPNERDLARGLAVKPKANLVEDFGRFRSPDRSQQWSRAGLRVEQRAGGGVEKELTVAAYGFDGDYLGLRPDISVWDDLVDQSNIRNPEVLKTTIELYESQAESRIEPGGLHILQGQRLAARDLYRHALDMTAFDDEAEDEEEEDPQYSALRRWWGKPGSPEVERGAVHLADDHAGKPRPEPAPATDYEPEDRRGYKYHHIIFPAHLESHCKGLHRKDAPASFGDNPDGCLLDPARLTWRDLRNIRENNTDRYRITYQQEDVDPAHQLVPDIWVRGGIGDDGVFYEGCFDLERDLREAPTFAPGTRVHSVVTADPSPTRYWAIQWWLWVPTTRTMHLMDCFSGMAEAPGILDWEHDADRFSGILERWHSASCYTPHPIRTLIVEINAAQRFLTQYDHFKRWKQSRSVSLVPHTTGLNKSDQDKGVYTLQSEWKHARVRLPAKTPEARRAVLPLVDEVTRYPDGTATDDQVMAQWFLLWNAERLWAQNPNPAPRQWRPSWVGDLDRARLRIAR